jgi:hypothetical protein
MGDNMVLSMQRSNLIDACVKEHLMPRRFNSSRLRQAINNYNRSINNNNNEVRRVNAANQRAVDNYNREVRAYNASVRSNKQRLQNELARLRSRPTTSAKFVAYRTSVHSLHRSFVHLEEASAQGVLGDRPELLDLAEGEIANSVAVLNALDAPAGTIADYDTLKQTVITTELTEISHDLDSRWQGALFALDPRNPDAARHFCTSSRELLVSFLDQYAPDREVLAKWPELKLTDNKQVPRRDKLRYCLSQNGHPSTQFLNFVADDIDNIMSLFGEFNPATHGTAGRYDLAQLSTMKARVEGAILFLHRIVS